MNEKRTINISKETYDKLTKYCKENTLVMSAWLDVKILQILDESEGK